MRAWFKCALSIGSVKVVRHNERIYFCGKLAAVDRAGAIKKLTKENSPL
jgi:hypothetical protein